MQSFQFPYYKTYIKLKTLLILVLWLSPALIKAEDKDLLGAEWNFRFNPKNFNMDFSVYDQPTAVIMSKLSYLAYYGEEDVFCAEDYFQRAYPLLNISVKLYDKKGTHNTQYLLFATKDYLIISFRGTEGNFSDIYTDIKFIAFKNSVSKSKNPNGYKNMSSGHGGFRKALKSVMDKGLFDEVKQLISQQGGNINTFPVYTTGHSLGGGLATLVVEPVRTEGLNYSGTYTFAAPMSISEKNNDEFDSFNCNNGPIIHNIAYYRDYFSRAGKSTRCHHLKHVGNHYRLCLNKLLVQNNPVAIKFYKWRRLQIFKFHSLANILDLLQNTENSTENVAFRTDENCICEEDKKQHYTECLVPIRSCK